MSGPDLSACAGLLRRIAERRRERVRRQGRAQGLSLPARRQAPRVPFGREPLLLCEVKRRSPSRGEIAPGLDAPAQADLYARNGARSVSVLTEEEFFGGSLADLAAVKSRHPDLAVLRKDFLLDEGDLEVSDRAGADAVLLIASLLEERALRRLARRAQELGLAVLLEVHDEADVDKARAVRPAFTGINSRDLATFRVDRLAPLRLKGRIDWPTRLVYESGVRGAEDGLLALAAGFDGLLVGEAVVREPGLAGELLEVFHSPLAKRNFWGRLAALETAVPGYSAGGYGASGPGGGPAPGPLVKVCGLTRADDARLAADLGAALLGFVLAPSPRRVEPAHLPALLEEIRDLPALKVGVVVAAPAGASAAAGGLPPAGRLLAEGLLDALQFHGEEEPGECLRLGWPYYKAVRVRRPADVEVCTRYRCPRVLADAWAPDARGGTGRRIGEDLLEALAAGGPLWVAGGIGPDNVGPLIRRFRPGLIDASSRLESTPGRKDPALLRRFFRAIREAEKENP